MKQMVFEYEATGNTEGIELAGMGIRRTKDHQIVTKNVPKTLNFTANKSVFDRNSIHFGLNPYGF